MALKFVSDMNLTGLEYADDFVLLGEDLIKLQIFLDHLNQTLSMHQMSFTSSKWTMLLQNWTGSKLNLVNAKGPTGWGGQV